MSASIREIEKHLHMLSVEIGSRVAGSQAEKKAAHSVERHFQRLGLASGQFRFRFPDYLPQTCRLEIVNGEKPRRISSARPMLYTPNTPEQGVTGDLVFLQTGTSCDLQQPGLKGKIGLLLGSLNLRSPALRRRLMKTGLKALVVVDHRTQYRTPISVGAAPQWMLDFGLPVVGVPHLVAVDILKQGKTRLKQGKTRLSVTTTGRRVASESQNVWAEIPGQGKSASDVILITSHIDSVAGSPGANDNASGTAAVMELARLLRRARLNRTVRLVCFGVEERLSVGSYLYATRQVTDAAKIKVCINLDSIGAIAGEDTVTLAGTPALHGFVRKTYDARKHGAALVDQVVIYSDMFPLNMLGIPSVWCFRTGGQWAFHTKLDNIANVSSQAILRTTDTVLEMVHRTATPQRMPFPRKMDPQAMAEINAAARDAYGHPWNIEKSMRGMRRV
ncbi:MAG: M28 family metallopeptidase [Pirellulales bacterium]|nr:M28 family metallopeptidase [Pirellulales bacterium]